MQLQGLTGAEVRERVSAGKVNKISKSKTKTIGEIFIENIFSVFNYIITAIIACVIYFYMRTGDINLLLDSIGIITIAITNTSLAIIQEIKAKRALDKVNLLLKKEVKVVRDGKEQLIDQESIVQDDLIVIQRGDQAAVDGPVIDSNHLEIDESLLTGESLPVRKKEGDKVLSGSFCVSGNGCYTAANIGDESYASKVTDLAKKYKFTVTPLQKKINLIVKALFTVAVALVIIEIFFNPNPSLDDVDFIRKNATILISLIPQGLVLMASVTFALGVYRISKIGAIIQKLNAIESFSNVQVVCMDKTGTLTQNKLAVEKLSCFSSSFGEEKIKKYLGAYVKYTSDRNATIMAMEEFVFSGECKVIDEIPFSSDNKMSLLKLEIDGEVKTLVLGGHDILTERLESGLKEESLKIYSENNLKVYRNLLLGEVSSTDKLEDTPGFLKSLRIKPYCIVSISDQVRDDVMDAIRLFQHNGISFKILSGDAAFAVQAVAHKIGWDIGDDKLVSGEELESLNDTDFKRIVDEKLIFARLKPEHKLRIIKCLKADKIYTAMIGDGVNDLPAIKEAQMGIAMEEGSQITKEIADIVLLKNKFSLLPDIFNEGNKIVNTVSSVAKLFLTKNFLVIYLSLFSLIFLWDFPLTPRRVALINIFTIGLPSFMIALKNTNTSRNRYFIADLFSFVLLSALIMSLAGYASMFFARDIMGVYNDADIQMIMLTTMIITSVANFFSVAVKKRDENTSAYLIYGLFIVFLFIFLEITQIDFWALNLIKSFYEITYLKPEYWMFTLAIGFLSAGVLFALQKAREYLFKKKLINKTS